MIDTSDCLLYLCWIEFSYLFSWISVFLDELNWDFYDFYQKAIIYLFLSVFLSSIEKIIFWSFRFNFLILISMMQISYHLKTWFFKKRIKFWNVIVYCSTSCFCFCLSFILHRTLSVDIIHRTSDRSCWF